MRVAVRVCVIALLAFTAAACLATGGTQYVVYEPGTNERAKASPKQSAANAAKSSVADNVRADLRSNCLLEHGGLFGGGETVTKQCDCYASGILKTMGKDDLELYSQYKVLSTLSVARPEDVKKQCGFQHIPSSRGKAAPPAPPA
jgi:hypothetical protein